jgi:hypothetical protein
MSSVREKLNWLIEGYEKGWLDEKMFTKALREMADLIDKGAFNK